MKIESLIKRAGGTVVDMDAPKRQYHFKPEEGQPHEAPHVAIVGDATHAKTLLRIREGFRLAEGEPAPDGQGGDADGFLPNGAALTGSSVHSASYEIAGGETVQLGELVVMAFQDSGLSYEQWEDLSDQERYDYIDATLAELKAGEGNPDNQDGEQQQQQPVPQKEQAPVEPPAAATGQDNAPAADDKKPAEELTDKQDGEQTPPPAGEQSDQPPAKQPEARHADEVPLEERPRKELVALYKARFGREPSTRMNIPDIAAALSEDDD